MDTRLEKIISTWDRLGSQEKQLVFDLISRLSTAEPLEQTTIEPARQRSRDRLAVLLKLGLAKGKEGRLIPPDDTTDCLKRLRKDGRPELENGVYLGTNSQSVRVDKKPRVKRLYLLVRNKVALFAEVSEVLDDADFREYERNGTVKRCPVHMDKAKTWFHLTRVWEPSEIVEPSQIYSSETGRSIEEAISKGRATFFYVNTLENLEMQDS